MGKMSTPALAIKTVEDQTFLSSVSYDLFWGKVKLVGYTMKLRPDHMRMIQNDINIDYEKDILGLKFNEKKALLCDDEFGFQDGLHEPQKLLLTGFMYCQFENELKHMENLWHLINPNFKSKVSLRVLKATLVDLLYIAVDQRLKILMREEDPDLEQRRYLEQCEDQKPLFIERLLAELKDGDAATTHVTRAKFDTVFIPAFTRPSNLRQYLLHKTALMPDQGFSGTSADKRDSVKL
mmetsp:Transcript_9688/g.11925  ORF Transcript_9688/g.11925 Transcript_9688/m.11925 type:complete len:237 (-) Transcript_9688:111-821(-)